jgi:hypothetical protein
MESLGATVRPVILMPLTRTTVPLEKVWELEPVGKDVVSMFPAETAVQVEPFLE